MSNPTLSASLRQRDTVRYGARATDGSATSNSTVKYSTIIDAGSSGSRIYVYKWETGDHDKPLAVTKVFPSKDNSAQAVKDGGMYLFSLSEIPSHPSPQGFKRKDRINRPWMTTSAHCFEQLNSS